MIKNFLISVLLAGLVAGASGCLAIAAGAGGTAVWQGGKAISEENVSVEQAVDATLSVLRSNKITLKEKVVKSKATQIRGEKADGANVAVDLIKSGENGVKIEVRVGLGDKAAARSLLHEIKHRL